MKDLLVGWLVILSCIGIIFGLCQLPFLVFLGGMWGILIVTILSLLAKEIGKEIREELERKRKDKFLKGK